MNRCYKNTLYVAYLFSLLLLVLSGCSSTPDKEVQILTKQTPQQRTMHLAQLQQWKVTGKIAFIEKKSRNSATLSWQIDEKKGTQQLNLTSYLGINVLQLNSSDNSHEIKVDGKTYRGNNLAALVRSITGLTLPTHALTYWLKGIPYQENDIISYHATTKLPQTLSSTYNNERWQVEYANYQQNNNYILATKFSIKKDDLIIKIAINDWSITH